MKRVVGRYKGMKVSRRVSKFNRIGAVDAKRLRYIPLPPEGLRAASYFKVLSLQLGAREGIRVPSTVLLEKWDHRIAKRLVSWWGFPLMIRMDYASPIAKKPLGGLLVNGMPSFKAFSVYLLKRRLTPLVSFGFDRFANERAAGVLIGQCGNEIQVEVLGPGFDAGDLRLGMVTPHERIFLDSESLDVQRRRICTQEEYLDSRNKRICVKRRLLRAARRMSGEACRLLEGRKISGRMEKRRSDEGLPPCYAPLGESQLESLKDIIVKLRRVVGMLPPSGDHAASLSFFKRHGWVLWDIYGKWYRRDLAATIPAPRKIR